MSPVIALRWRELDAADRDALTGKLAGLYQFADDESAFDALAVDKQQALLFVMRRMRQLSLWHVVRRVENVYGLGGVGMNFDAWPVALSTLVRRRDFTRFFARRRHTDGGFYERARARAALHFLYVDGESRRWSVHFDLYSPTFSFASALRHLRDEVWRGVRPDWSMIEAALDDAGAS